MSLLDQFTLFARYNQVMNQRQFGIDFGETDLVEFINECYI